MICAPELAAPNRNSRTPGRRFGLASHSGKSRPSSTLGNGTGKWAIQIGVAVLGEVALLAAAAAGGDRGQAGWGWVPRAHVGLDHDRLMRAAADRLIGCRIWRAGTEMSQAGEGLLFPGSWTAQTLSVVPQMSPGGPVSSGNSSITAHMTATRSTASKSATE